MLPFTVDQFFEVFAVYNRAIWPVHIAAYVLAVIVLWALFTERLWSGRAVAILLGAFWLWNGLAYHLSFFAPINPAAYAFAALFVVQGVLFVGYGLRGGPIVSIRKDARTLLAVAFIAYAMVVYSLIGVIAGHGWPRAPMFGVAPCPTTIFTFGVLMLATPSVPWWLIAIPVIWALIGSTAAVLLGVPEDLGLLAAAVAYLGNTARQLRQ
jgi:hypothetical protein